MCLIICICVVKMGSLFTLESFKFSQNQVDFVGYNIGWVDYKPSDDMLSAIKKTSQCQITHQQQIFDHGLV